jgi:hypothetical protein
MELYLRPPKTNARGKRIQSLDVGDLILESKLCFGRNLVRKQKRISRKLSLGHTGGQNAFRIMMGRLTPGVVKMAQALLSSA